MTAQNLCFRATMNTTNPSRDTFAVDGKYYDCKGGEVFLFAPSIKEAAAALPNAEVIEFIGFAYEGPRD